MNNETLKTDLLNAANYPMSATRLANAIGKSKASQIQAALDELVSSGDMEIDNSGKYPTYKKAEHAVTVRNRSTTRTVVEDAPVVESKKTSSKLPEGYKAGKLRTGSDGKEYRNIMLPNGRTVKLQKGYTLVNINNGEVVVQVKDGLTDSWNAVKKYINDKGLRATTVDQTGVGRIGKSDDIVNQCGIVEFTVKTVNKAA